MTSQECVTICDAGINTITDLEGRGLVTSAWLKEGLDALNAAKQVATTDVLNNLPGDLLTRLATDPHAVLAAAVAADSPDVTDVPPATSLNDN